MQNIIKMHLNIYHNGSGFGGDAKLEMLSLLANSHIIDFGLICTYLLQANTKLPGDE